MSDLVDLLNDKATKARILNFARSAKSTTLPKPTDMFLDAVIAGLQHDCDVLLESAVLRPLGELGRCTFDDIKEAFQLHLTDLVGDGNEEYGRFVNWLDSSRKKWWRSAPMPIGSPSLYYRLDRKEEDYVLDYVLLGEPEIWKSPCGSFVVQVAGTMLAADDSPSITKEITKEGSEIWQLYVTILGKCTQRYFAEVQSRIIRALDALVNCYYAILQAGIYEAFLAIANKRPEAQEVHDKYIRLADLSRFDDAETGGKFLTFLRDGLTSALQEQAGKKNSVGRRIRNAVHLLTESQEQRFNGIGLSLAVAAIEALLCDSSEGVVNQFKERVAILLENDPQHREAAEDWAKRLYTIRSKVLHGESIDCTQQEIRDARLVAAAVLKAMFERRTGVRRVHGSDETVEDLLRELRSDKYLPQRLTFVEESPVTRLWRSIGRSK